MNSPAKKTNLKRSNFNKTFKHKNFKPKKNNGEVKVANNPFKTINSRAEAALIIYEVVENKKSLNSAFSLQANIDPKDRALIQEICFGVLRNLPLLVKCVNILCEKPLKAKYNLLNYALYVGLYQLIFLRTPEYATVNETVNSLKKLQFLGMKNLVNAVLRNFIRNKEDILDKLNDLHLHPNWIFEQIKENYPQHFAQIIQQNNAKPPMFIRVNTNKIKIDDYLTLLDEQNIEYKKTFLVNGLCLKPVAVEKLPHFADGFVSVQDLNAQLSSHFLADHIDFNNKNLKVLDACSAPGGKACALLDKYPDLNLICVDVDNNRIDKIKQNLDRTQHQAKILNLDLSDQEKINKTDDFNDFDLIILDAPCSATGIIRRHPDIKWLRHKNDIANLSKLQLDILHNLWQKLKVGGKILYITCSILPEENFKQIQFFLQQQTNAKLLNLDGFNDDNVINTNFGLQFLPKAGSGDGFFYALLEKLA